MNELCANCGASLFSPQSTICVVCERDPRYKETEVGPLYKTWIYDKAPVPNQCISCGTSNNLEELAISYSANEGKKPFLLVVFGWLLPGIWRLVFLPRIMDKATEPDRGTIDSGLKQCALCKQLIEIQPMRIDQQNKRFEIVACQSFINASTKA